MVTGTNPTTTPRASEDPTSVIAQQLEEVTEEVSFHEDAHHSLSIRWAARSKHKLEPHP